MQTSLYDLKSPQMTRKRSSWYLHRRKRRKITHLLELGDGLRSPEDAFWSIGSNLGCLAVSCSAKQLVKLGDEELVSSTKVVTHSHAQGKVVVIESALEEEEYENLLMNMDRILSTWM